MTPSGNTPPPKKPTWRKRHLFARSLASVAESITTPMLDGNQRMLRMLMKDWEHIVGSDLSRDTAPSKLHFRGRETTGGTLQLKVRAHRAPEIPYLSPQILELLARYIGFRAIERIVIDPTYKE
jgi:hypothetical protein